MVFQLQGSVKGIEGVIESAFVSEAHHHVSRAEDGSFAIYTLHFLPVKATLVNDNDKARRRRCRTAAAAGKLGVAYVTLKGQHQPFIYWMSGYEQKGPLLPADNTGCVSIITLKCVLCCWIMGIYMTRRRLQFLLQWITAQVDLRITRSSPIRDD